MDDETSTTDRSGLTHQWVIAGIVAASARFIPIPFVDDIVVGQCRRFVVARTLAATSSELPLSELKPYYANDSGCLSGCIVTVAKLPLKMLLFPVRKFVAVVTSFRGVPMEIIRTVLLGRTLERQLQRGGVTSADAVRMRAAFDEAFSRMDFRAIRAAVRDAVRSASHWRTAAMDIARRVAVEEAELEPAIPANDTVETSASKVQAVLEEAETAKLFAEFDSRFDEAYHQTLSAMTSGGIARSDVQ